MRRLVAVVLAVVALGTAGGLGAGLVGAVVSRPALARSPRPGTAPGLAAPVQQAGAGAGVARVVAFALSKIGTPYEWGGDGRDGFYDCSGFTMRAFQQAGVHLPRTAAAQYRATPPVDPASLQVGDLLFWAYDSADPASVHHVAIYLGKDSQGRDRIIDAPHTGATIQPRALDWSGFFAATRPLATP